MSGWLSRWSCSSRWRREKAQKDALFFALGLLVGIVVAHSVIASRSVTRSQVEENGFRLVRERIGFATKAHRKAIQEYVRHYRAAYRDDLNIEGADENAREEMDERGTVMNDDKFALVVSVYKEWGENNEKVPEWANANASRDNYFVVQPFYQRIEASKPAFVVNKGFESGVYMRYIVDNYHNLPEAVIFVQADGCEVDMNAVLPRVTLEILDQAGGFLPLNCLKVMGRSISMWGGERGERVEACWREVSKHFELNLFEGFALGSDFQINMVCCACFAVKRELLLSTPFEVWNSFYERSIVKGQCVEGQLDIDEGKHETAGTFEHLAHVIFGRKDPLWEPKCFDDFATIVNNEDAPGSLKQSEVYASEKVEKQPVTIVENADGSWSKLPELVKRLQCNVVSDSKSTLPILKIFALEDFPSLGHFQMSVVSFFCWLMNQVEDADNITRQTGRIQLYVSTIVNTDTELQNVADLYYKPFLESIASYAEMNFDIHLSTLDVNDWYTNLHINANRISCYDDNETVRAKEIEVYHRSCSSSRQYKGHCGAWFDKQSNVDHFRDFLEKSLNLKEIAVEAMSEVINATRILIFDRAEGYAKSYEDANLVVSAIQNECKQCNVTYFQADLKRGGAKSFEWNCRLIASYDIIIAAHGSFLANLPCAKPNSALIEIIWRDITDMSVYEPLAYQLGLKYRRVNFDCVICEAADPEDHPVKPDLAELRSALQSLTEVTTELTGNLEENGVDVTVNSQKAKENTTETLPEAFRLLSNKLMKNQYRDSCTAACFYSTKFSPNSGLGSRLQFVVAALTFAIEDGCVLIASPDSSLQLFGGSSLKELTNCKDEDAKDIKYIDLGASDMDENGLKARYMRYVPQFDDLGFKDSIMLWQSVALSFLMRATESFANIIQEVQNEIGWYDIQKCRGAVISMHVRHGDKGSETSLVPLSAYLKELALWLENAEQNQEFKCIFVATDDGDLQKRLEDSPVLELESGRKFKVIGSWQSIVAAQKLSSSEGEFGALLDLHLLSRAKTFCFIFSSNFGRLAMHMNPVHLEARAVSSLIPMDYYHHAISSGFFFVHQQNVRGGFWSTVAVYKEKISSKLNCEPQYGCSAQTFDSSQNETYSCCRLPAKSDYVNGVIGPVLSEIFPDEYEKYCRVIDF
ncbi:unnamed protein product [Bathycoccus prasinos]